MGWRSQAITSKIGVSGYCGYSGIQFYRDGAINNIDVRAAVMPASLR